MYKLTDTQGGGHYEWEVIMVLFRTHVLFYPDDPIQLRVSILYISGIDFLELVNASRRR